MNLEVKALLEKAKRSQKAASRLFKDGDTDFAASVLIILFSTLLKLFYFHENSLFRATQL